jgi:hypothetical protein
MSEPPRKVVFCVPTLTRPFQQTLDSLRDSMPEIEAAGWESGMVSEIGCPYISAARATMLRKALDAKATHIVFIDHDVSWEVGAMLKLLETEGEVVAGTYRFKEDEEKYMGTLVGEYPVVRKDGCIQMVNVPAGFLRITRNVVNQLMRSFPELIYGEPCGPSFDLFNHGAYKGIWWGEDYAFCRRWVEIGGEIWCIPDLNIAHHTTEKAYPGNFHKYMLRQPGGSDSDCPVHPGLRAVAA